MPVTVQEMNSVQSAPMCEFYDAEGVTGEYVAKGFKKLAEATTPKTHTLKGWFDRTVPMVDGWRVIKGTTQETLLEELLANDGVRLKALVEISKQKGLYPSESVNVKHSLDSLVGDVVREILDKSKGLPPLPSEESK